MDRNRIAYLIQRFRSHQATPEEIDELESFWYLAQSDDAQFNMLSDREKESIRIAMLDSIKQKIFSSQKTAPQKRNSPALSWTLRIAAGIVVIVAVTFLWLQNQTAQREFRTAYGEQLKVRLPDRSVVVINGNSSLRYDSEWGSNKREVWMTGEGFFEVTHTQDDQAFVVHTESGMDVQVLGTKFNVKVRRGKAEVMLQEGKIRLDVEDHDGDQSLLLQPGDLAVLENQELQKTQVQAQEYISWKENKLFFDRTSLSEIAMLLEDTYGMEVIFENESLRERTLSGEISAYNATDIIEAVRASLDVKITHDESRIVVHQ